jgi:hypothetical protein
MSIREIGCCGAYCKTCRTSTSGSICRGCKLGYGDGERDIDKAKCKINVRLRYAASGIDNLKPVPIVTITSIVV